MAFDDDQNLWIGTYFNGLCEKTPVNSWANYNVLNSDLPGNKVQTLAFENNQTIWLGTESGLSYYNNSNISPFGRNLLSKNIKVIRIDRANNKWIGTDKGLNLITWDGQVRAFTQNDIENNGSKLLDDIINDLAIAPLNETCDGIYIATEKGLNLLKYNLNIARSEISSYVAPNPLNLSKEDVLYFTNLPSEARIDIYTLDGRSCGTFYGPSAPAHTFSIRIRTDFKRQPVSGIYFYRIHAPGAKAIMGKFVVLR
jgi:ligand-binding sensor domain-containing protein